MKIFCTSFAFRSKVIYSQLNRPFVFALLSLLFAGPLAHASYIPFNTSVAGNIGVGTATPQAKFVVVSGNVGIGTWTADGGNLIVNGTGNVGIGSVWPGQKMDVLGTIRTTGLTMSGQTPVAGYILTASDSAGDTTWTSASAAGGWTVVGNGVYETSGGNVGIGTSALQTALAITNGNVGIGTWTAAGGGLIVASGNVGIGSAWPGQALDVNGAIRTTTTGGINFGTDNKALIQPSATTTPDLKFLTNSIEIMRITNGGNVGIGSTLPGQKLDVLGTIRTTALTMSGQTPVSGYVLTASDSAGDTTWTSASAVSGWTVSGNNVYETLNGNVGIGTSALQTALAITNGNVGIGTWTAAGGGLIVASGNVGIGSVWPGQKLDIQGTVRTIGFTMSGQTPVAGYVLSASDSAGDTTWISASAAGGWTVVGNNVYETQGGNVGIGTSALQTALAITNGNVGIGTWTAAGGGLIVASGNVGIGSAWPGQASDVNGAIRTTTTGGINFGTDNKALIQPSATTTPDLKFLTNSIETMRITNGGNVGIGSTLPGQKLDVLGTIRTTALTMSGQTPISGYVLTASDSAGDTTWTSASAVSGWTVSGNNVYETLNGNVGIGTSALQTALAITNGNVGIGTWTAAGGGLIVASGNVGIGSVWPGQKLDIQGTVRTIGFTMSGQTPVAGYVLSASDSAGDTTWISASAAGGWTVVGNSVYETSGGNVGIGTSALQTALAITNGNVGIGTWTAAGGGLIVASGNVGIGSAWPGQALDVNGAIRTTTTGGINFGADNKALIQPSATTTPDLKFLTNSIEIMRDYKWRECWHWFNTARPKVGRAGNNTHNSFDHEWPNTN